MRRFRSLLSLGFPIGLQLDDKAGEALQVLVDDVSKQVVGLAVKELRDENGRRDKWAKPLKRLLPRHVMWAREKVFGPLVSADSGEPVPQKPDGEIRGR